MRNSHGGTRFLAFALALLMLAGCAGGEHAELPPLRGPDDAVRTPTSAAPSSDESPSRQAMTNDPKCVIFEEIITLDRGVQDQLDRSSGQLERAAERGDRSGIEVGVLALISDVRALVEAEIPALVDAYDRLILAAPELTDDIVLVRDVTVRMVDAMAAAEPTIDGYRAAVESLDDELIFEGAMALLRLDQVSRRNCGLVLAN